MPSPYPIQGAKMKIKNIGKSNFMLKDKRGNSIILEPSFTVDVDDEKGKKLVRFYPTLEEVKEEKKEVKAEAKEEKVEEKVEEKPVEVSRETKKKRKK